MAENSNSSDMNINNDLSKSPISWHPNIMSTPFINAKDSSLSLSQSSSKLASRKAGFPAANSLPWWRNGKFLGKFGDNFGTPSYPSPLDRIRKQERAIQLGLSPPNKKESFECNQSLPPLYGKEAVVKQESIATTKAPHVLTGKSLHSFSFSPGCSRGTFSSSVAVPSLQTSSAGECTSDSWIFYNFVGGSNGPGLMFPTSVQNPNKAVLTVHSVTKEILVVNKMACQILNCGSSQIIGHKLDDFLMQEHRTQMLDEVELDEDTGQMLPISGKVVDLKDAEGSIVPVSLWIRNLENEERNPRSLVVMEPVQRTTANIVFDDAGIIMSCDAELAALIGQSCVGEILGTKITKHIPSLIIPSIKQGHSIPKSLRKQRVTGRTIDGTTFPLSIRLSPTQAADDTAGSSSSDALHNKQMYHGLVWVFSCISGIITISPDGIIQSCNNHFAALLFGYMESDLVGKSISTLIPTFYDDADFLDTDSMPLPPFDGDDDDDRSLSGLCDSRNSDFSPVLSPQRPPNPTMSRQDGCLVDDALDNLEKLSLSSVSNIQSGELLLAQDADSPSFNRDNNEQLATDKNPKNIEYVNNNNTEINDRTNHKGTDGALNSSSEGTVTNEDGDGEIYRQLNASPILCDNHNNHKKCPSIPEGSYFGVGVHHDGADIDIIYQIKRVELENGTTLYCLWVSRDPEEPAEGGRTNCSLTLASSFNSSVLDASTSSLHSINDQSHNISSGMASDQVDGSCMSMVKSRELPDSVYTSGAYSQSYTTLKQIGKGAFGCVKMSFRNSDNLLVITKFIRKSKVYKDCWIVDQKTKKKIPLEISLLSTLSHPNIVKIFDVFENDKYYQMIMEKHGSGMDLFEFIDRGPRLDEKLTSYIFRQVVDGVAYLHSLNILHRDIKDENIILDERFNVKLIDFGSASLMTEGHLFSTFCGTMEYCSPEVLLGNRYRGPELEMWALGITLFTLVFGENPFYDAEETIAAKIRWPFQVSKELKSVIAGLLDSDPKSRTVLTALKNSEWVYQIIDVENYNLGDIIHASKEEMGPSKYYVRESAQNDSLSQQLHKMQINSMSESLIEDYSLNESK